MSVIIIDIASVNTNTIYILKAELTGQLIYLRHDNRSPEKENISVKLRKNLHQLQETINSFIMSVDIQVNLIPNKSWLRSNDFSKIVQFRKCSNESNRLPHYWDFQNRECQIMVDELR